MPRVGVGHMITEEERDTATGKLPVPMGVASSAGACRSKGLQARSSLYLLPPPQPRRTSFISCSLH
jgi:hypothetical protein